jgi:hypothetical protein
MRYGNAFGGPTAGWSGSRRDIFDDLRAKWVGPQLDPRWLHLLRGIRLIDSHPDDGCPKRQDCQGDCGERSASHLSLGG